MTRSVSTVAPFANVNCTRPSVSRARDKAVTKMKSAFGLRVGQQFPKFCAMHIVCLNT
jgi:hypothetical protein